MPLRVRGESRGVVTLSRFPPGVPYTADDLAIAVDIADRAAMSIENARMFRDRERAEARLRQVNTELSRSNADLEQSNRNLQQFAHIAATVADARSLKSTLNTIAEVVVDATGAGACAIVLVDGQPPQAHVAGLSGCQMTIRRPTRPRSAAADGCRHCRRTRRADPCSSPTPARAPR